MDILREKCKFYKMKKKESNTIYVFLEVKKHLFSKEYKTLNKKRNIKEKKTQGLI